jgi:hypothetical protein
VTDGDSAEVTGGDSAEDAAWRDLIGRFAAPSHTGTAPVPWPAIEGLGEPAPPPGPATAEDDGGVSQADPEDAAARGSSSAASGELPGTDTGGPAGRDPSAPPGADAGRSPVTGNGGPAAPETNGSLAAGTGGPPGAGAGRRPGAGPDGGGLPAVGTDPFPFPVTSGSRWPGGAAGPPPPVRSLPGATDADPLADEHFIPPPPPRIILDPMAKGAWTGLFGGPGYLVVATLAGWTVPGWAAFFAVAAFIAGFTILVLRVGDDRHDSDPDDGAVV